MTGWGIGGETCTLGTPRATRVFWVQHPVCQLGCLPSREQHRASVPPDPFHLRMGRNESFPGGWDVKDY